MALNKTVEHLWTHAVADRTRDSYYVGYSHFEKFLLLNGVQWFRNLLPPISEDILIFFVAYCFDTLKLQHSTIKLYLCGIRYQYMKLNSTNPFETSDKNYLSRLSLILKSVKRLQGLHTRTRLPITFDILEQICKKLSQGVFNSFIDCMLETACIVAFFGFLRCGEFTVKQANTFDSSVHLCVSDVIFYENYALLKLKESKTDPFRKGIFIQLHKTDNLICPFLSLKKYLKYRSKLYTSTRPLDPLFITGNRQVLDRYYFLSKVKHVLQLIGYDPNLYNGHSFRSGAATSASKVRMEDHLIKTLGRWSSESYCRYIKTSTSTIKNAQKSLMLQ